MRHSIYSKTAAILLLVVSALLTHAAWAQVSGNAFQGFKSDSKSPIQVEADQLEVLDGQNKAVYNGRVKILQGSSVVTTDKMVVHYGGRKNSGGQGGIERLDFNGNLVVTSGTNTATADKGTYWVRTEKVELVGNVVVSQGASAAKGCRLTANLKTNVAKIHACKSGGRVSTILTPNK